MMNCIGGYRSWEGGIEKVGKVVVPKSVVWICSQNCVNHRISTRCFQTGPVDIAQLLAKADFDRFYYVLSKLNCVRPSNPQSTMSLPEFEQLQIPYRHPHIGQ